MLPATFKLCAAISYRHLRNMTGEGTGGCGPRVMHFVPRDPFLPLAVFLGLREEGWAPFPAWLRLRSLGALRERSARCRLLALEPGRSSCR